MRMIVFALRHANRTPDPEDDLTPAGIARAKLLARMLAGSGIRTAFCSDALRTQKTIAPLKNLLGDRLEVVVVGGGAAHVQQTVDRVKALQDDAVAAVIGHSNTIGPILGGLSGPTIDPIGGHEFDKLFVLFRPSAGASAVALMRYGDPT
jgi:phosphohistidine phosphatase SixA